MADQPQFERINAGQGMSAPEVLRLQVPGGWIYHLKQYGTEACAVFVPDPTPPRVSATGAVL